MPAESSPHEFIYDQVKASLLTGTLRRGERIDLQVLADRHRVSVTPVREVIFRLIGERLVQPQEFGGFEPRMPIAAELQQLYAWNGQHLLSAAHMLPDPVMRHVIAPFASIVHREISDAGAVFARLSLAIGAATGNLEFVTQIRSANDRLTLARRAEGALFGNDLARELRSIVKANGFDVRNNVRRRLTAYHRRRVEAAPQIAALMA